MKPLIASLLALPFCSCAMQFTKRPDGAITYGHQIATDMTGYSQTPEGTTIVAMNQSTSTQAITTGVVTKAGIGAAKDALVHATPGGLPAAVKAFQN